VNRDFLNQRTLCWFCLCFELHVVMMRSMNSVFWEQQLLHCQTLEQSNARCGRMQGEEVSLMWKKRAKGGKHVSFCERSLWTTSMCYIYIYSTVLLFMCLSFHVMRLPL